jgi:hypothetical protein
MIHWWRYILSEFVTYREFLDVISSTASTERQFCDISRTVLSSDRNKDAGSQNTTKIQPCSSEIPHGLAMPWSEVLLIGSMWVFWVVTFCGLNRQIPAFRRNIWRVRQYVPPKHWCLPTSPHVVTTQKTDIDKFTVVRTVNLLPMRLGKVWWTVEIRQCMYWSTHSFAPKFQPAGSMFWCYLKTKQNITKCVGDLFTQQVSAHQGHHQEETYYYFKIFCCL